MPEPRESAMPRFAAGDTVLHASEGVCSVQEIRSMRFGTAAEQPYYILKPSTVKSSSTVYMPVARGNAVLRRLLTRADIDALIERSRTCGPLWVEDSKQRREVFRRVLQEGDYAQIIHMISEIHIHGEQRTAKGRKPCAGDEGILSEAEHLLHQEFSCVLNLSAEETVRYVRKKLESA